MSGSRAFASLAPRLLARKGAARPAMRPASDSGLSALDALAASQSALGWDDMGTEPALPQPEDDLPRPPAETNGESSQVVDLHPRRAARKAGPAATAQGRQESGRKRAGRPVAPPIPAAVTDCPQRRAAFTLRLDAERHFKLRLATTLAGTSAQTLVTEALDRFLADFPQLELLAGQLGPAGGKA